MRTSRSLLTVILLTAASTWSLTNAAAAGNDANSSAEKLRGDLDRVVREAADAELIPITVVLRERGEKNAIARFAHLPAKKERRQAVTADLERRWADSSPAVVRFLKAQQLVGSVGERITELWIAGAVATQATPGTILQIAARDDVAYINHDRPIGLDVFPVEPPVLEAAVKPVATAEEDTECGVDLMGAPRVWAELGLTGDGVVVGVIDTGACITHPDLENQLWHNDIEFYQGAPGVDDDNNGYIDDFHGWNFRSDNDDINDYHSHGTHVAGTIGGDGSNGVQTGMAPDVELMILRFWNNPSGESTVWEATQYALDNGADIISASIGWPLNYDPDKATWRLVCENAIAAGMVVVYAAGNDGDAHPLENVRTPGNVPDVIAAGATDCADNIAEFSSRGPVTWQDIEPYNDWPYPPGKIKPSVVAPGVDTVSTSNDCWGYTIRSGTSMATPHLSGTVALMLEADPSLDHFAVKDILMNTAVDLGEPGTDNTYGAGRVDTFRAVRVAMNVPEDINLDGRIDMDDLLLLLDAWGPCTDCPEDIDGDGDVDAFDLIRLLHHWDG